MNVREAIQILAKTSDEIYSKICRVDSVDLEKRICDVTAMDGSGPYLEMRLQPIEGFDEGVLLVPEVGSLVVVTFFSEVEAYVACGTKMQLVEVRMNDLVLEMHRGDEENGEQPFFSLKSGEEDKETFFGLDGEAITVQKRDGEENCPTIRIEEKRIALENGKASIVLEDDKIKLNKGVEKECFANGKEVEKQLTAIKKSIEDLKMRIQASAAAPMDGGTAAIAPLKIWDPTSFWGNLNNDKIYDDNIIN